MRSLEHWRIALGALRANWFRAILTALGVVIGVASLLAVSAVRIARPSEPVLTRMFHVCSSAFSGPAMISGAPAMIPSKSAG